MPRAKESEFSWRDYRTRVDRLDDWRDKVEYLLNIIDELKRALKIDDVHEVDKLDIHFTNAERRVMVYLWDGEMRHSNRILSAMGYDNLEPPAPKTLHVVISRVRKKVKPLGWKVKNLPAHGYKLVKNEKHT